MCRASGTWRASAVQSERQMEHSQSRSQNRTGSWSDELNDFLRAFSGAFIFAIPLLYTMEMWWIGISADLWKMLVSLVGAFFISFGLAHSRTAGFKDKTDRFASLEQAVDVLAVGLVGSVVVLAVLNRIQAGDPLDSIVGKVVVQAVPLSIGASVANAIFGPYGEKSRQGEREGQDRDASRALVRDLGATVVGGIFIGFAIAPTEEIPMLAAQMSYVHELALIGLSLLLSYIIVFASGYGTGQRRQAGPFQRPITETFLAYLVSLLVALATLYLFDRVELSDPIPHVISMVVVLGLPTTIGGAAGRLVV